jgi:glycerophosphoryl diester phosphodiesterase
MWSRRTLLGSLTLALAVAACGGAGAGGVLHPYFRDLARPLVIAHRGGADLWPENTLTAFRGAHALGADVLELDVQASADGVPVVLHDATVDRTTDGHGRVDASTLAALRALDAGYRWSPDGERTFPYRGRGLAISTLEEVLDELPTARLSIEIKTTAVPLVLEICRLLAPPGRRERVMVASFESRATLRFRRACPDVATGATPSEVGRFVAARALRIVPLPRLTAAALQIPERYRGIPVLTPSVIAAAHAQNLQVHAWVSDDEHDLRRLLALGVDGIVTDRPDRLLAILGRGAGSAQGGR